MNVIKLAAGAVRICAFVGLLSVSTSVATPIRSGVPASVTEASTYVETNLQLPLAQALNISLGEAHSCAVTRDGETRCWGLNLNGQLGDQCFTCTVSTPITVPQLTPRAASVAAGARSTCVLTTETGVKCWGLNFEGSLGRGDGSIYSTANPGDVVGVTSGVASLTAGNNHYCAITSGGAVKCWGRGYHGLLGNGGSSNGLIPVDVIGLSSGVKSVDAGEYHACAITAVNELKCWGENDYGQLGNGLSGQGVYSDTPITVSGLGTGVIAVSAGRYHTCAIVVGGGVKCWGWNVAGELGNQTTVSSSIPVDVYGLTSGVKAISSGSFFSCALKDAGQVVCWGSNGRGQLGNGTLADSSVPVEVVGLGSDVRDVVASMGYYACAVLNTGIVKCWGSNGYGQLGRGTVTTAESSPEDVVSFCACRTLQVGYVDQTWMQWQIGEHSNKWTWCGPSSLAMALTYETGQANSVARNMALVAELRQAIWDGNNSNWWQAKQHLVKKGFKVNYPEAINYSFDQIRQAIDSNHVLVGGWYGASPAHWVAYVGYQLPDIVIVNDPYGDKSWFDASGIPNETTRNLLKNWNDGVASARNIGADPRAKGRQVQYHFDELPSRGHFLWITGPSAVNTSGRISLSATTTTTLALEGVSVEFSTIGSSATRLQTQTAVSAELRILTSTVPALEDASHVPLQAWDVLVFDDTGASISSAAVFSVAVNYSGLVAGLGDADNTSISESDPPLTIVSQEYAVGERNLRLLHFDAEAGLWHEGPISIDIVTSTAYFTTAHPGKYALAYVALHNVFLPLLSRAE